MPIIIPLSLSNSLNVPQTSLTTTFPQVIDDKPQCVRAYNARTHGRVSGSTCGNYIHRLYSRRRGYRAFSRVCLFVRALKGKRLELSTPNLVHIILYSSRSACIDPEVKKIKGQGHAVTKTVTVARLLATAAAIRPCAAAADVGLHVDTTAYVFYS